MNTHSNIRSKPKRRVSAPRTPTSTRRRRQDLRPQIFASPSDASFHPSATQIYVPPESQQEIGYEQADCNNQNLDPMACSQLASLRWKKRAHAHFNNQEVKMQEGEAVLIRDKWRGRNHSRAQNLKNIANHILNIIISNENLTVKQIGYLLFQIMGHTKFGLEVIETNYPEFESETILELTEKYKDDKIVDSNMKNVVRNVRRRLYDALNVMLSTQIIRKLRNSTFKIANFEPKLKEDKTQQMIDEDEQRKKIQQANNWDQLLDEMKKTEKRIAKKKRLLKEKQEKLNILKFFINRNQSWGLTQSPEIFQLPLIIVKSSSKLAVHLENETLRVNSGQPIQMFSDLDVLEMIQNCTMQERIKLTDQIIKKEEL